jgi:galactokinase
VPDQSATAPATVIAFGPGRVNLVGEHTDYNDGLALAFPIALGVTVRAAAVDGDRVLVRAADLGEDDDFGLRDPGSASGWRAFARGMVAELRECGHALPAMWLEISGDVPRDAGLSSSAALETAMGLAMLALAGDDAPDRRALAALCSRVENVHVGAQTGLLDQLTALLGDEGHALRIDFRSLQTTRVPLPLDGWRLTTLDSGEPRSLASSGYNRRRGECREACALLGVGSVRDVDARAARGLPGPLDRRILHVIEENARVDEAVAALQRADMRRLGDVLTASHLSLRDQYEVSTAAVERTVSRLMDAGATGARLMGGGFGGQVLALFAPAVAIPDGARVVVPGPAAHVVVGAS